MVHRTLLASLAPLLVAACAAPAAKPPASAPVGVAPAAPTPVATASAAPARLPATGMSPQDIQALLGHHNKVRAEVGVGPMAWSGQLAAYAQQWAEQLAITNCQMKHRNPNTFGENLFQGTLGAYTAVDAAKAWESEKKDYAGGVLTEANWAPSGHYTQMVWRETTQLGCGQAICRNTLLVACNYNPAGNVMGRKPY
jgi:pathogenesis-related protein 1